MGNETNEKILDTKQSSSLAIFWSHESNTFLSAIVNKAPILSNDKRIIRFFINLNEQILTGEIQKLSLIHI